MKRETIENYIKNTTKPYKHILERAKIGGWNIEELDKQTYKLKKEYNPSITLYFYDKTLKDLSYWIH
jgi:hypothetical protein